MTRNSWDGNNNSKIDDYAPVDPPTPHYKEQRDDNNDDRTNYNRRDDSNNEDRPEVKPILTLDFWVDKLTKISSSLAEVTKSLMLKLKTSADEASQMAKDEALRQAEAEALRKTEAEALLKANAEALQKAMANVIKPQEALPNEKTEALLDAIKIATETKGVTGPGLTCNLFAAAVGKEMNIPYFKDEPPQTADQMYDYINSEIKKNPAQKTGWVVCTPEEAQEQANNGGFVVGIWKCIDPNKPFQKKVEGETVYEDVKNGHIVIGVPAPPSFPNNPDSKHEPPPGYTGPWAIDGQHAQSGLSERPNWLVAHGKVDQKILSAPIWVCYKK